MIASSLARIVRVPQGPCLLTSLFEHLNSSFICRSRVIYPVHFQNDHDDNSYGISGDHGTHAALPRKDDNQTIIPLYEHSTQRQWRIGRQFRRGRLKFS